MAVLHAARRPRPAVIAALICSFSVLAVLLRCSGTPSAPSPTAVALSIVPLTERLAVGDQVDLVLEAEVTPGIVSIMSPLWQTDDPTVLLVKPLSTSRAGWEPGDKPEVVDHYLRGHVTALARGAATVYAECQHGRAAQRITVF